MILHRLQNCEIYLVGVIDSLIVSKCRNCTIFAGVVRGSVQVRSSTKTNLTTCCRGLTFSDEEQNALKGSGGNIAYVSTLTRPLVECLNGSFPENGLVSFAPCNAWYKGMLADLSAADHNLGLNRWNQAYQNYNDDIGDVAVTRVPPSQFTLSEIPFDFATISDMAAAAESTESFSLECSTEFNALYSVLPESYSKWIKGSATYAKRVQEIMLNANNEDPKFHVSLTKHYEDWLQTSNKLHSLEALQKMKADLEKIIID